MAPKLKADFEADLNRWIGKPVQEFIQSHGKPAKTSPGPEGRLIYVFNTRLRTNYSDVNYRSHTDSKTGLAVAPQLAGDTTPSGGHVVVRNETVTMRTNLYCRLIIETNADGMITATKYEGNDCW